MTSRLEQLSALVSRYATEARASNEIVRETGWAIIERLPAFLGNADVFGVPPEGDWTPEDHGDDAFSFGRLLTLRPARMGVAIRIPYEDGDFDCGTWVRMAIEFEMEGGGISVFVGDLPKLSVAPDDANAVESICENVFLFLRSIFEEPVSAATALGAGKIGFRPT